MCFQLLQSKKSEISDDIDSFDELEDKHDVTNSMDKGLIKRELPLLSSFAPKNKRMQANKHLSLQIPAGKIDQNTATMASKGNTANSHNRGRESQELLLEEEDSPFKINVIKVGEKKMDQTNDVTDATPVIVEKDAPDSFHLKPVNFAINYSNLDNKEADGREELDSNNGNLLVPRTFKEEVSVSKKNFDEEEIELIKKQ